MLCLVQSVPPQDSVQFQDASLMPDFLRLLQNSHSALSSSAFTIQQRSNAKSAASAWDLELGASAMEQIFEIRETKGRGLGCFAKIFIKKGRKILKERPLMHLYGNPMESTAAYNGLTVHEKHLSMSLHQSHNEVAFTSYSPYMNDTNDTVQASFLTDSFSVSHGKESILSLLISRVNHSCLPMPSKYTLPKKISRHCGQQRTFPRAKRLPSATSTSIRAMKNVKTCWNTVGASPVIVRPATSPPSLVKLVTVGESSCAKIAETSSTI